MAFQFNTRAPIGLAARGAHGAAASQDQQAAAAGRLHGQLHTGPGLSRGVPRARVVSEVNLESRRAAALAPQAREAEATLRVGAREGRLGPRKELADLGQRLDWQNLNS